MKKNYFKLLIVEMILMLFSFFYLFILKKFNYIYYLVGLVIITIITTRIIKIEKRKERFNTELMLIILISLIFYYVFTYASGFFVGFFYSTYSRSFIGIIRNIFLATILFLSIETLRERVIKAGINYKSIIIISYFVFTLLEIPSIFSFTNITSNKTILEAITSVLIPIASKNVFLTYCTYKSGRLNSLIYQFVVTIPTYVVPIFPNLGDYFTTIINLLLPMIVLLLAFNIVNIKREKVEDSRKIKSKKLINRLLIGIMVFLMLAMMYLTCGLFRFFALAIGSESMTNAINKGDLVIIDKKYKKLSEGDILAFNESNKIIVHRITQVIDDKAGLYKTKGDKNNSEDSWIVEKENIVGKVKLRIRLIGWPTVALSELISK